MWRGDHPQLQDTCRNGTPAAWTASIGNNLIKKKVKETLENRFWLYQTDYSWLWSLVSALCQATTSLPRRPFPSNLLQAFLIQVFSLASIWVDTQCSMSVTWFMCPSSWSQHDKTLIRHLPCIKLRNYTGDTGSQQAFQSTSKPNSATAPLIPYLECSDFHSMLKSVSFFFLLELRLVSAALPSLVFLDLLLPHSHLIFFLQGTKILKSFVSSSVWLP